MFFTLHKSEQSTLFTKTHTCLRSCLWDGVQAFQDLIPAPGQSYFSLPSPSALLLLYRPLLVVLTVYLMVSFLSLDFFLL